MLLKGTAIWFFQTHARCSGVLDEQDARSQTALHKQLDLVWEHLLHEGPSSLGAFVFLESGHSDAHSATRR